jgi:hypothetical protein
MHSRLENSSWRPSPSRVLKRTLDFGDRIGRIDGYAKRDHLLGQQHRREVADWIGLGQNVIEFLDITSYVTPSNVFNLYSITTNQAAIIALFRTVNRY